MRHWLVVAAAAVLWLLARPVWPAEITEVLDAADEGNPFDLNIDVGFHSTLNRAKITHEWSSLWTDPRYSNRPDFNELRFQEHTYAMDFTVQIGLYHDLEIYVNLPWVIQAKKEIGFVKGVSGASSTLYRDDPASDPSYPGNALAVDPATNPTSERSGIGDMTVGVKWAPFSDQRDDTKSVWVIGLDYTIPSGTLANPSSIVGDKTGGVGMGQHVITPYFLFSHRFKYLDPYAGIQGSIPIQGREAQNAGFETPYHGGFLTGMEIVPWENPDKHQKFAIDIRLTTEFYGEVQSKGHDQHRGTVNEISDFLSGRQSTDSAGDIPDITKRQLQYTGEYTQFGMHLGFVIRAAEFVRLRAGVSLSHNTEHFISGADFCDNSSGLGDCTGSQDVSNKYRVSVYDNPGRRLRVEETTLFTYWVTGMITF